MIETNVSDHTYFWKNSDDRIVSPYFDSEDEAKQWCEDKVTELDDPKRLEFEEKRNYEWDEWKAIK